MTLSILYTHNPVNWTLSGLLVLVIVYWIYLFLKNSHYTTLVKTALVSLRLLTAIIFLLFLLDIQLDFKWTKSAAPHIAFIWDNSESMISDKEAIFEPSLVTGSDFYKKLNKETRIHHFVGSEFAVKSASRKLNNFIFSGTNTNLSSLIRSVEKKVYGQNIDYLFLVSDGQNLYGESPERFKLEGGRHLYTLGFGQSGRQSIPELSIIPEKEIFTDTDSVAFLLKIRNMANSTVAGELSLQFANMEKTLSLQLSSLRNMIIPLRFPPQKVGDYILKVLYKSEESDESSLLTDLLVSVEKDKKTILIFSEIPEPDSKIFANLLSGLDNIDILTNKKQVDNNIDLAVYFLTNDLAEDQDFIQDYSIPKIIFSGEGNSKLAAMISDPGYVDSYQLSEYYPFMLLREPLSENMSNWKNLPPIFWNGKIPNSGKTILTAGSKYSVPVFTYDEEKNIFWINARGLWKWHLSGFERSYEYMYRDFIQELVAWLMNNTSSLISFIESNYSGYVNSQTTISANIASSLNTLNSRFTTILSVTDSLGTELFRRQSKPYDHFLKWDLKFQNTGDYSAVLSIYEDAVLLGSDSCTIHIAKNIREITQIGLNSILLKTLAENNGGVFTEISAIETLNAQQFLQKKPYDMTYKLDIRERYFFIILLFLLAAIEWSIRKYIGTL